MPLVNMQDLIHHAYENRYAVGAFDLVSLDFLEAVIEACEYCRAPVILSVEEPHVTRFDFELMLPAIEAAARRASIPVAIQIDHASSLDSARHAIRLGCNGIMIDASRESLPQNIEHTRDIADMAHRCGIPVGGELGYIAGQEGEGAVLHPGETRLTTPAEAKTFAERSGVDFLSVSIGTVQGRQKGRVKLDIQRLKQVHQVTGIPLMIHGGSGLHEDQFQRLTAHGVAKIDYYTALSDIAAQALREQVKVYGDGGFVDITLGVKAAIREEVIRCLRLWGSAGRAAEVLSQCRPWTPVDHLIVYNVATKTHPDAQTMMREGQRMLGDIPGVREVFAGEAVEDGAAYRYCWRIRFASPEVIESYRDHPQHVSFADALFRPIAADRITTDYRPVGAEENRAHPHLETHYKERSGLGTVRQSIE